MKYSLKGQHHAQIKDWWQRPCAKQPNRLSFHFPVGTWGASSSSSSVLTTSAATGAATMGSSSLLPERSGWSKLVSSLSALILSVLEYVDTRSQIQQDVNWKWSYFNNDKIREYSNTCVWNRKECKLARYNIFPSEVRSVLFEVPCWDSNTYRYSVCSVGIWIFEFPTTNNK